MKTPDPLLRTRDPELQDWVDYVNLVINTGKYETPVYSEAPSGTQFANEGESLIHASEDGVTRTLYFYINGVFCAINFDSNGGLSTGAFGDKILDNDQDTGIFTQYSADEDRLRHYSNGVYVMAVDTYGMQVPSDYKIVFDGLGGDTYWTYSSASSYLQAYVNGSLRMEM